MNRSGKVLQLIEEIINPESSYISDGKEGTTTSKAHSKLKSESQRQLKNVGGTEKIKDSAHLYSRSGYSEINNLLRKNKRSIKNIYKHISDDDFKNHINNIKTLTKNPTRHEFYTYRGTTKPIDGASQEGDVFQDKGFVSTSLNTRTAKGFFKSTGKLFRIHITPGTKGHYISGHDRIDPYEREFVLHPGTKFRVGKTVTHPSGIGFTELHVHSQEE